MHKEWSDAELEEQRAKEGRRRVIGIRVFGEQLCVGKCVVFFTVGPRIRGRNEPSSVGRFRSRPAPG